MPELSDTVVNIGRHIFSRAAAEQGGIISGDNPTHYNASNPIRLWIIQATIIIAFTQILGLGLKRIRQPRVIAEVIAGIILGPTVMGRIPDFSRRIFPPESLPLLSLVANIGLTLFLFLVGLEIDEKIEDIVTILFLPLYFTLSGLRTNLGLLDDGKSWGYIILICTIAFFGKFLGCAGAARFTGFNNREAGAIGVLMSCKGLVELIVLNIGLQAGILDTRVFSMFVFHAIILTFITTPLTVWIYPSRVRKYLSAARDNKHSDHEEGSGRQHNTVDGLKTRFTVVLHRMEYLPSLMSLVQFLQPPVPALSAPSSGSSASKEKEPEISSVATDGTPRVCIEALRLIELTERTSVTMRSTDLQGLAHRDSIVNIFRTFSLLNKIPVTTNLQVLQMDDFASNVSDHARDTGSDLVIIPWAAGTQVLEENAGAVATYNPMEAIFGKQAPEDKATAVLYSQFIRGVFAESPSDVALFFDHGLAADSANGVYGQHIILPFFGGPDDRLALSFVVQLCTHPAITATIIRVTKTEPQPELETALTTDTVGAAKNEAAASIPANNLTIHSTSGFPDTVYPNATTQTRVQSDMADNIAWNKYAAPATETSPRTPAIVSALTRVTFEELASPSPLHAIISRTEVEGQKARDQSKSLLAVIGRARRLGGESHAQELKVLFAEQNAAAVGGEVRRTLGDVACAFVVSKANTNLLVVQAAAETYEAS
ncbi:K(+)/H(+) antiporter [Tulasnella sp. 419]|nr:K(+)/H(+) antiporter [Tulasnella sp. 419]